MKSLGCCFFTIAAAFCLSPFILSASGQTEDRKQAPNQDELAAAARRAIGATYKKWGNARVELDKETLDSILASDFYVSVYGKRISREKFLSDITEKRPDTSLTRFDTDILTVRKSEDGWTVVISEKLEISFSGSNGRTRKVCSFWVTRDDWREEGGKWVATSSEAIGHESWPADVDPPIKGW